METITKEVKIQISTFELTEQEARVVERLIGNLTRPIMREIGKLSIDECSIAAGIFNQLHDGLKI